MSDDTKAKLNEWTNSFFKVVWLIIAYFAIDVHVRLKELGHNFDKLNVDYFSNKAEMRYRVKAAEDYIATSRRERMYNFPYNNHEQQDDNAEGDQ